MLRNLVIVAAHFPPSNLAGVHRARLLSQHLPEFGWRPIIVTTHWRHYEEMLDWDLTALVDPSIEVIRTWAMPTWPVRFIGDIGVRAMPWHLWALRRLRRNKRMDFLLITVPSFYSAMLGQLLWLEAPLAFGIDYIDPWLHVWPEAEIKYSKAWLSMKLSTRLEPWAVRNARLITAVAPGYYEGTLERNPRIRHSAVTAAMPYGFSANDLTAANVVRKAPTIFDPTDGRLHLVYAGALLPKAYAVLECLLKAVAVLKERNPTLVDRLRLHFIGTGKTPNDRGGHNVLPLAQRLGVADYINEHPHRMSYVDVLAHLTKAYGVLIVGSTEAHYTPSKIYQAVQSRRPIFAILHEASTAVEVLQRSRAGISVSLTEHSLPDPERLADAMENFIRWDYDPEAVVWTEFEAYSARESARRMAAAIDEAMERYELCGASRARVFRENL